MTDSVCSIISSNDTAKGVTAVSYRVCSETTRSTGEVNTMVKSGRYTIYYVDFNFFPRLILACKIALKLKQQLLEQSQGLGVNIECKLLSYITITNVVLYQVLYCPCMVIKWHEEVVILVHEITILYTFGPW